MTAPDAAPGWVVVALGSNLGDSGTLLRTAASRLHGRFPDGFRGSSLWRSEPVDCPPGSPPFLNAALAFRATALLTPEALLADLQAMEREFGRRPKQVLNEARPLDLDLILFADETRDTPALRLPHPRAHLRGFVLGPLAELLPDLRPPGWQATVRQTLAGLPPDEGLLRLKEALHPGTTAGA